VLSQLQSSTVLLYSIAIAAGLIYAPFLVVGWARAQVGYDRSSPRAMFDKLPPYAQRATWAHQNAFESFMVYAAAAFMAYVTQQQGGWITGAAIAYVVARLFYPLFYVLDIPALRSLMFGIGSSAILILFTTSLMSLPL
jgi:uncharacterized MAPEG superfamily protein